VHPSLSCSFFAPNFHPLRGLIFGGLALIFVEDRQIVEQDSHQGVLWSQLLLSDVQRSLVERMVGGEIALPTANSELYVTVSRYTAPQCMVICD